MSNKEDKEIGFAGVGAVHCDTIFKAKKNVILGHTSPADSDRRFGGAIYLVFETLMRMLGDKQEVGLVLAFALGDDSVSRLIVENLKQRGITGLPMLVPGHQTASYNAFHNSDGNLVVAAICREIYENVTVEMVSRHMETLKKSQFWIFDSAYNADVNMYLAMKAAELGIFVFVVFSSLASVGNIHPLLGKVCKAKAAFGNKDEFKQVAQKFDDDDDAFRQTLEEIASWGTEIVFATCGDKGVMVYDSVRNKHFHEPAPIVEDVKSSHGAGDTFAAVVIHYLRQGRDVEWATKAGVIAAGLRVSGREKEINEQLLTQLMQNTAPKNRVKEQISSLFHKFTPQH